MLCIIQISDYVDNVPQINTFLLQMLVPPNLLQKTCTIPMPQLSYCILDANSIMKFYLGMIKVVIGQNEKLFLQLSTLTIWKPPDSFSEVTKDTS